MPRRRRSSSTLGRTTPLTGARSTSRCSPTRREPALPRTATEWIPTRSSPGERPSPTAPQASSRPTASAASSRRIPLAATRATTMTKRRLRRPTSAGSCTSLRESASPPSTSLAPRTTPARALLPTRPRALTLRALNSPALTVLWRASPSQVARPWRGLSLGAWRRYVHHEGEDYEGSEGRRPVGEGGLPGGHTVAVVEGTWLCECKRVWFCVQGQRPLSMYLSGKERAIVVVVIDV